MASRNNVSDLLSPINENENDEAADKDVKDNDAAGQVPNENNDEDYYIQIIHNQKYDLDPSTMRQSMNAREFATGAIGTGQVGSQREQDAIRIQSDDNYSDGMGELRRAMDATPVINDDSRVFITHNQSDIDLSAEEMKNGGDLIILSPKLQGGNGQRFDNY